MSNEGALYMGLDLIEKSEHEVKQNKLHSLLNSMPVMSDNEIAKMMKEINALLISKSKENTQSKG